MNKLGEEIKTAKICVVSNTHWDREFRFSFEKTRRNLLDMLDTTLDILEQDPTYHSFTMDGHAIMIDDYLEMRPQRRSQVERFIKEGRLIIGPYYTLAEQFSISHEALIRNLMMGRETVHKYGGKTTTVAYTPSSWGQTGQYPQILADFGLNKMMFYRGISHHEAPAEYIWEAPDATQIYASRFALYCRYNWYYQVHRSVTKEKVWTKDYIWGEDDEVPFRPADGTVGAGVNYVLEMPACKYDRSRLKQSILDMLEEEKGHFTTPVFLAMNGHDISAAYPRESEMIKDAQKQLGDEIVVQHTDLEGFWEEALKYLDKDNMTVLKGERRAYLKEGKWTFLFPATISARTYLKQMDFDAYTKLVYLAEPLTALAGNDNSGYLHRGWKYLLSNHTHDANGGCAPDSVCMDMEYRYRKVADIADIAVNDAMSYIVKHLSPEGMEQEEMQLVVYNTLPFKRDMVVKLDMEIPSSMGNGIMIEDTMVQLISTHKSGIFMDSIWEVPTILDSTRHQVYAKIRNIPPMGYKTFQIKGQKNKLLKTEGIAKRNILENSRLKAVVNANGTVDVFDKLRNIEYKGLNYLTSQGEIGNAWKHVSPQNDKKFISTGVGAKIYTSESGALSGTVTAEFDFEIPAECSISPSDTYIKVPVKISYTLQEDLDYLQVKTQINNQASDCWIRANFPTGIISGESIADSHFDIVKRPVQIPDSEGWVEQAFGTHPLRSFAALCDEKHLMAVMPKGLYEYEAFEDGILALTLIRSCRIKLAVSEEKTTVLNDKGIRCMGEQCFEYALYFGDGDYNILPNQAAQYFTPVKCAVAGRGQGNLPKEKSLFAMENKNLHITAVKPSQDREGIVIRLYNGTERMQPLQLDYSGKIYRCTMNEDVVELCTVPFDVPSKKIITLKLID